MTTPNDLTPQYQPYDGTQPMPNAAPATTPNAGHPQQYAVYAPPSYPPNAGHPHRYPNPDTDTAADGYGAQRTNQRRNPYTGDPDADAASANTSYAGDAYAGNPYARYDGFPTGPGEARSGTRHDGGNANAGATDAPGGSGVPGSSGTDSSPSSGPASNSGSATNSGTASGFAAAFATPAGAPPLDQPYYGCPPQEAFLRFFRKYVTVSGRASRSEYWWWILISLVVAFVLRFLSGATDGALGFLATIWMLGTLIPGFAIAIRRLHDSNRPGWLVVAPYSMWAVGGIAVLAGAAGAIFGALNMLSGSGGHVAAGVGGGALFIGIIVILAGIVVNIVLMAAPTKPEGARFDGVR